MRKGLFFYASLTLIFTLLYLFLKEKEEFIMKKVTGKFFLVLLTALTLGLSSCGLTPNTPGTDPGTDPRRRSRDPSILRSGAGRNQIQH